MIDVKHRLIQQITQNLHSKLEFLQRAAEETHADSTSDENKAEGKYDTRGIEAAYLAGAQAQKLQSFEAAVAKLDAMEAEDEPDSVLLGSLVVISSDQEELNYLLLPAGAGSEIKEQQESYLVISPSSPIGTEVLGKELGASVQIPQQEGCYISEIY